MMKLYQIEQAINDLLNQDELSLEQLEQSLTLDNTLNSKLDDMLAYQHSKEIELKAFEISLKDKLENIKQAKSKNENLKEFIKSKLLQYGIDELKSKHFLSVKISNAGGCNPVILNENIDIDDISPEFVKITKEVSKTAVREALEAGEVLTFARLGEKSKTLKIK